ncbi:MAG: hypothetical protein AW07_04389 [Candidatus Accumulibacter sp. SK-11]|nr:MAG: hypothetical protein AW07_04389 [Candidatus Accumulibacter sp. SK-11]
MIAHWHARPAAVPVWLLVSLFLCDALPALAQAPATIAEADGIGNVDVNIVYYPDLGCADIADVREGAPGTIEPPERTLVVTVTLDRQSQDCPLQARAIERKLRIADRADALSVDVFFVDADGRFVRSQRPRIYRQLDD